MDRRSFLAAGATGVGFLAAGCSGVLGETVDLADPTVGRRDGGSEKHLTYRHRGERVLTVGFDQRTVPESATGRFGLRISVPHSDDTSIESFRFDLRAPRSSVEPPADIFLESPGGGLWPDLTFEEVENRWTRIALEDTGELGEGTISLETIVDPLSAPAEEVGVRVELELSAAGPPPGRTYRVDTATEFEPVVG